VTEDSSKLADILDSIEAGGTPSSQELQILVAELKANRTTMATGEGSIALGGSADGAIITSGDRNIVIPPELTRLIQDKMGGSFNINSGSQITNNYYFLIDKDLNLSEQQKLPKLIEILESIDLEILKQIYREILPIDAELSAGLSTNIDRGSIVAKLHNLRLIPTFINRLIDDDCLPKQDRDALELIFPRTNSTKPIQSNQNRILESYLSIVIRPSATNSNKFSVNGWLTFDNNADSSFYSLDLDASTKGINCTQDRMSNILDNFLKLALRKLRGKEYNLTIEIFLPMNLLCMKVDRWEICDYDEYLPVGTKYRTIIRTSDRLDNKYLDAKWSNWKSNWERVKNYGHSNPKINDFETIDCCKSCNWKRVTNNLSSTKLGLKLTSGLVAEHKLEFFKAILRAATPIAVWVRCDLPNLDLKAEIDDLIAGSSLFELSAAVLRKRQQADEEDPPEVHLGAHLVMLWEDPHRLTPDVKSWLSTPGQ
jgi:hypothetical protein